MKKKSEFLSENFQFLVVKFSIYLNKLVFIMKGPELFGLRQHWFELKRFEMYGPYSKLNCYVPLFSLSSILSYQYLR